MTRRLKFILASIICCASIGASVYCWINVHSEESTITSSSESIQTKKENVNSCRAKYSFPKLKYIKNDLMPAYIEQVKKHGVRPVKKSHQMTTLIKQFKLVPVPEINWAYALKIKDADMRYATPQTRQLIYQVSSEFKKRISKTDLYKIKLKISSLFRLKNNNPKNSSNESAHKYGCAFDVSYAEFLDQYNNPVKINGCQKEFLQMTLEKVVEDFRLQNKLYKTKETGRNSNCFHIVPNFN